MHSRVHIHSYRNRYLPTTLDESFDLKDIFFPLLGELINLTETATSQMNPWIVLESTILLTEPCFEASHLLQQALK